MLFYELYIDDFAELSTSGTFDTVQLDNNKFFVWSSFIFVVKIPSVS